MQDTGKQPPPLRQSAAFATFENGILTAGNGLIERRWALRDGRLFALSLRHLDSGREWIAKPADLPSLTRQGAAIAETPTLTLQRSRDCSVEAESLKADFAVGPLTYRIKLFDDLPAVGMQLIVNDAGERSVATTREAGATATGIEHDTPAPTNDIDAADILDAFPIDPLHHWLLAARFIEQTDANNNLVFENTWSLHTSQRMIALAGNVFYLEHRPTQSGLAMLKIAPSPEYRPVKNEVDLQIMRGQLILRGHGLDATGGAGYMQWTIAYHGDRFERMAAIQSLQQRLRPYVAGRDGVLLTNTWGDRSRDAAVSESFLLREIEAASAMQVDVLQIDDGWQKGITANSSRRDQGGVWNGFWANDPEFWTVNRQRFPRGLEPIVEACKRAGMSLGLWYAPDSTNDMSNWRRDAEQILSLHRQFDVCHFKIDAVKMHSKLAERRLAMFYEHVLTASEGRVTFDADVTAEVRPGYFGQPHVGVIFVENRYTDWHNYWPHQTLRNLWRLSHHIHPRHLRMEFLNPHRHVDKYAGDPLGPAQYSPAALFASVMFASPLSWMEVCNAPQPFRDGVASLAAVWKQHRHAIHQSAIIPIGDEPDGYSWCGFVTHAKAPEAYAVVYRPLGDNARWSFSAGMRQPRQIDWLHGAGRAAIAGRNVEISLDEPLGYGFLRVGF